MKRLSLFAAVSSLTLLATGCPEGVDPNDQAACSPACSSGYACYRGQCRAADGGVSSLLDATMDGDSLAFDAVQVAEAGGNVWFKNSFSNLDTDRVSKEDIDLSKNGIRLAQEWQPYGNNLLSNPGFEDGTLTGWTDKSTTAALISSAQKHGGSHAVGGEDGGHEIYQEVDVSAYAPYIDLGRARASCGMYMLSAGVARGTEINRVRFVASFHFAGSVNLNSYDTTMVSPATWTLYKDERMLDKGIRRIRVWHRGYHEHGTVADCYGDDAVVQLQLQKYAPSASVIFTRSFGAPVNWGVFSWSGLLPPGTAITCHARTSPSGAGGWREWSRIATNTGDISGLPGVTDGDRAIEVKITLASNGVHTPTVTSFLLQYESQ